MSDGRIIQAKKFYYNYLIPFYIARHSLITPDFTNELADLSVGDAWAPSLERAGGGHSVVVVRSPEMRSVVNIMRDSGELVLDNITEEYAMSMHGHMLDFKKRGCFIRLARQRRRGQPVPEHGYEPAEISNARYGAEYVIGLFLWCGRLAFARKIVELMPLSIIGPMFDLIRRGWKAVSKPTKRRGLAELKVSITPLTNRWNEVTSGWDED